MCSTKKEHELLHYRIHKDSLNTTDSMALQEKAMLCIDTNNTTVKINLSLSDLLKIESEEALLKSLEKIM
ncbi:hypothetical protein SanaruYs_27740 [Chryseotalea sanaruensis]|uniref:Uncharacterized protein n=2 Tax=Chryseotalea sanaruensis TaxID=2482724 RepID=A0A401UCC1_9BACT|nr:hypothetical protein SanaruYs_27740 [Chryseotalea sanaruensis]